MGGYFEGLLNPDEATRDDNFSVQDILEQSIIIPIWKRKGDRRECSQYRAILDY